MEHFNDLSLFLRVAQAGSFTAAAQQLCVSKSSLSQNIANLEQRLGVRLLNRTTRSIAPTEAGERLLEHIAPHFAAIRSEIERLGDFRDTPAYHHRFANRQPLRRHRGTRLRYGRAFGQCGG